MCTLAIAFDTWPGYRLVVAGNRDEFYARPTAPAHQWADHPNLIAGRDLKAGGTWLGVSRSGRFATLTNLREPALFRPDAPSRGALVQDFLTGNEPALAYLERRHREAIPYNGFNLLCFDGTTLAYYSDRAGAPRTLPPGLYALSNAILGVDWPKVTAIRAGLAAEMTRGAAPDPDRLAALLADRDTYPDERLPSTGVPIELERTLSALCIVSPIYGTVCHSVLSLTEQRLHLAEITTNPTAEPARVEVSFPLVHVESR
jgi:uncharacterized protein with NRDE domain